MIALTASRPAAEEWIVESYLFRREPFGRLYAAKG